MCRCRHVVLSAVLLLAATSAFAALQLPPDLVVEATATEGAVITYAATVLGPPEEESGRPIHSLTCSPASQSTFPIGTTTVLCVATNGETGSFNVTVQDTTAPLLTVPRDFAVFTTGTSQVAEFAQWVSALDRVDGAVGVTCNPPSGSTFFVGETPVTCTASDSRGNAVSKSFLVIVYDTLPHDLDKDIVVEATGPNGATVTFAETGCTPASGSVFPIGRTNVSCGTFAFTVTVTDSTGPALSLPANISATTTDANGTNVTFTATATDLVDGSVAVTCNPASGSLFPVGTTSVHCTASDSRGNASSGDFSVQVTQTAPPDTTPPVLSLPSNMTVSTTNASGAIVAFTATALDAVDGVVPVTCTPASGSNFPVGMTTVNCSATDASHNTASGSFTVDVQLVNTDTTPPVLSLPANITVDATSASGAVVTYTATATDAVDGVVPIHCVPPSGATFAIGTTSVLCTATDASNNTSSGTFSVTVRDGDPPAITSLSVNPAVLSPPNHRMVEVTVTATVTDNLDPVPNLRIYGVVSNENIVGDWNLTGSLTVELRAERDGAGTSRVYTILIEAVDASGNRSLSSVTVTVPHDQSGSSSSTPAPPPPSKRRAVGRG